jgi:NADPH2:quinone reductase
VLVRVDATGVSFAEQAMRRNRYPGQPKFPFVPGYDLVGTVSVTGADVDPELSGRRVAALTKTGGWTSHALVDAADVVIVPNELDPAEVESLLLNGLTAWQMLHRKARTQPGQTILVHGANGGVGTVLVQLARHHGVRVIGVASPRHHDALRELGALPVDYADPDALVARVRELAPEGVDAVFDNIGGDTLLRSWSLLAPGGTLVSYALASALRERGSVLAKFIGLIGRLAWWQLLPNGRRATFYDVWSGRTRSPDEFRQRVREDLGAVMALLARKQIKGQVAARFALADIAAAMKFAESRTAYGKVVLIP